MKEEKKIMKAWNMKYSMNENEGKPVKWWIYVKVWWIWYEEYDKIETMNIQIMYSIRQRLMS